MNRQLIEVQLNEAKQISGCLHFQLVFLFPLCECVGSTCVDYLRLHFFHSFFFARFVHFFAFCIGEHPLESVLFIELILRLLMIMMVLHESPIMLNAITHYYYSEIILKKEVLCLSNVQQFLFRSTIIPNKNKIYLEFVLFLDEISTTTKNVTNRINQAMRRFLFVHASQQFLDRKGIGGTEEKIQSHRC